MVRFVTRCSILTKLAGSFLKNLTGSILKKILFVAACVLGCVWVLTPALAQRPGVHPGGGGRPIGGGRMGAPPSAPIARPPILRGPRGAGPRAAGPRFGGIGPFGPRGSLGFRPGPIPFFRSRLFFGAPFFRPEVNMRFVGGLKVNSLWWPTCGPSLGWTWGAGFECYPFPFYGYNYGPYGVGNNLIPEMYESPVYVYGGDSRDLIWLYRKDGAAYPVVDYWLVNGEMHFKMAEDDPTKPTDHAIPYGDVDVQKTIYVNSHRGFRVVFRDEPWQQYLKDHPDLTPPDVPPPQKE